MGEWLESRIWNPWVAGLNYSRKVIILNISVKRGDYSREAIILNISVKKGEGGRLFEGGD